VRANCAVLTIEAMAKRLHIEPEGSAAPVVCPYCGEPATLSIEPVGMAAEQYVEDCPVCCRPWNVSITRDGEGPRVELTRDDD